MKILIEEMQKQIGEGKIKFHGVIEVQEEEKQKGRLKKSIVVKDSK